MWAHEQRGETTASPAAVWEVLRDLDHWPSWDTSMEWVRLRGPFAVGAAVEMKPKGQEPIASVIVEAAEGRRYADETAFGGVTLRFSHTLVPLPAGGTRIIHRLEITGPDADAVGPELGPAIVADFPEALAGLIARAEA